ncbi:hypothetical protein [Halomicronema sp. CCY15110]|uniref:hypothetical protein n=1 Tax=Halomicronema sp. CCY15110 TaxID=2767773 RepID=UPI0019515388|nr:hypothetical protein [Halomicronema sp. CCY15110]
MAGAQDEHCVKSPQVELAKARMGKIASGDVGGHDQGLTLATMICRVTIVMVIMQAISVTIMCNTYDLDENLTD